jgi:hypothetical protein
MRGGHVLAIRRIHGVWSNMEKKYRKYAQMGPEVHFPSWRRDDVRERELQCSIFRKLQPRASLPHPTANLIAFLVNMRFSCKHCRASTASIVGAGPTRLTVTNRWMTCPFTATPTFNNNTRAFLVYWCLLHPGILHCQASWHGYVIPSFGRLRALLLLLLLLLLLHINCQPRNHGPEQTTGQSVIKLSNFL